MRDVLSVWGRSNVQTTPALRTRPKDLDRAKIEYLEPNRQADFKCTGKTLEVDLLRARVNPLVVSLLTSHSLPSGCALTDIWYAGPAALLNVKRQGVGGFDQWLRGMKR